MELVNHTYLSHKIVQRPTGTECRFAAIRDDDGMEIADTVSVPDGSDLQVIIQACLDRLKKERDTPPPPSTEEPLAPGISIVDQDLSATKDQLKVFGCGYIKAFPECTEAEYFQAFYSSFDPEDAMMAPKLVKIYTGNAFNDGLIAEANFVAFRDFVAATPAEILMGL